MCTRDIIRYACPCVGRAGELHPCRHRQTRPPGICCYTGTRMLKLPHKCKACMRVSLNKLIATKSPLIKSTKLGQNIPTQATIGKNLAKQANVEANVTEEYTQLQKTTADNINLIVSSRENGILKGIQEDAVGLPIYYYIPSTANQKDDMTGEQSKEALQYSAGTWLIDTTQEVLDHTRKRFNVRRGLPEAVKVDLPEDFGDLEKWWNAQNLGTEFIDMLGEGTTCGGPLQVVGLCYATQDYSNPDRPSHCSFLKGDQIQVYRYCDNNWWLGVNLGTGKGGYFQKEFVTLTIDLSS